MPPVGRKNGSGAFCVEKLGQAPFSTLSQSRVKLWIQRYPSKAKLTTKQENQEKQHPYKLENVDMLRYE
jgi:hypothetical protein